MKLDFSTICDITVGAMQIWQEENGVHFSKCTKEQLVEWEKYGPSIFENTKATTGVRLDFYTDSSFVKVEVAQGKKFEVKINGLLTHKFTNADDSAWCFEIPLKGKLTRVTIVLPCHNPSGVIKAIEIEDGATVEKHAFDKKILFLGDSITQGWDADYDSLSFAYLLSDFFNADSIIQGVGSARFAPETAIKIPFNADMVVISYGTNDYHTLQTLEEILSKEQEFLGKIKELYNGAEIFVISPIWRMDTHIPMPVGSFENCCCEIKKIVKKLGIKLIDGEKMVPPIPRFMADDLHPNDLGFSLFALNLLREMGKA